MKRRSFIKTAGLTALSACVSGPIGKVIPAQAAESRSPATGPLSGRRILTFNSVIRVNQIEITRTRNWSLLGRINQKQTRPQDQPCPLAALPENDRALIRSVLPELGA